MKNNTQRLVIIFLMVLMPATLAAQDIVTVNPPTVVPGSSGLGFLVEQQFNLALQLATNLLETEINTEIGPYIGQDELVRGFANAGASVAHVGTQRSYNDYRRFALTVGTGAALSAPSPDPAVIESAVLDIETEGDIYFGAAVQPIAASLGLNLGRFVDRTYLTLKVGYASIDQGTLADEFSFESLVVGGMIDYQLLRTRRLPLGFLRWRGLTIGSGLLFQTNESDFELDIPIDPQTTEVDFEPDGTPDAEVTLEVAPVLTASVFSSSWSIPVEATTGLRILWLLDVNVGAGFDIAFGDSDVSLDINSPVTVDDTFGAIEFTEGSVAIDAGTEGDGPQIVRPRLTAGVGLNLGPVKLDVPVMYYFDADGNSAFVGINVGIVW